MIKDIIVTLPQKIEWSDYQKELDLVADHSHVMRFKVPHLPKDVTGGRCWLVWRGRVRGWMMIVGLKQGEFTCSTTGTHWSGKFIERSGPFVRVNGDELKGFQGWRYYDGLEMDTD